MFSHISGRRPVAHRVALWIIVCSVAVSASAQQSPTSPFQSGSAPQPVMQPLPMPPQPPTAGAAALPASTATAGEPMIHRVQSATERLEMTVNSSRILTLEQTIPRLVVGNPDLLQATPLSPNEVQIFAKKAGATQVNLFNDKGQIYTVDCIIYGDVRQLSDLLRVEFPTANINIKAIAEGHVLLTGYVDRSDHIAQIVQIAHTFFPAGGANAADDRVISNIEVVGVQQILLKVKVAEVSRTKLRHLGMDWANIHGMSFAVSSIGDVIANTQAITGSAGVGNDTMRFGIVNGSSKFFGFIQALQQEDLVKILAEPDVATVSGRPAQFRAGGQVPYPSSTSINGVSVSYMDTGVTVDFLPIVLGNGNIRLEVRPVVRELDETVSVQISPGVFAPGFTERKVDTGVEMKPGQTLALAGLVSSRIVANKTGFPWISDLPYFGVPFRKVRNTTEDVELLIIVTPELVAATDCHETPPCLPGMHTDNPNDCELYWKGYIEVPSKGPCGPGGCQGGCQGGGGGAGPYEGGMPGGPYPGGSYETVPQGTPTPGQPQTSIRPVGDNPAYGTSVVRMATATGDPNASRAPSSSSDASYRYNPSRWQNTNSAGGTSGSGRSPGYLGPVGYDVLN